MARAWSVHGWQAVSLYLFCVWVSHTLVAVCIFSWLEQSFIWMLPGINSYDSLMSQCLVDCHTNQMSIPVCEYSTTRWQHTCHWFLWKSIWDTMAVMRTSTWILWLPIKCGLAHLNITVSHNMWNRMWIMWQPIICGLACEYYGGPSCVE